MYDTFAPQLAQSRHVYAITRRGFGASSIPKPNCQNYSADRLGDDVLAVMEALKIEHPVLVGLSVGGEELSSVGSRHPEKVAGLVYLEAGYEYAYYNDKAAQGNPAVDAAKLRKELEELVAPYSPKEQKERIEHILKVSMPRVQKDLEQGLKGLQSVPDSTPAPPDNPVMRSMTAVQRGVGIYSGVGIPVLAIYATPHSDGRQPQGDPEKQAEMDAADLARVSEQAKAFEAANPAAHVILLPHASHLIIQSNEADVLREMNAFLEKLQ
jgi:pimeloyl-ACP methyl ester carboxylesterase